MDHLWLSRAESTIAGYTRALRTWIVWAEDRGKVVLPAAEADVAAFLLQQGRVDKTPAPTGQRAAALRWLHKNAQLPDPTDGCATRALIAAKSRLLKTGQNRKKEITPAILEKLVETAAQRSGGGFMIIAYMNISFAAFLRFQEARALLWEDIQDTKDGMIINIKKAKNDQTRAGKTTYISYSGGSTCAVTSLRRWKAYAKPQDAAQPIFTQHSKLVSYSYMSQQVKLLLNRIGEQSTQYALHSWRAGGASLAAQRGVSREDIQRHGRWKDPLSLQPYINPSPEQKYAVTRVLITPPTATKTHKDHNTMNTTPTRTAHLSAPRNQQHKHHQAFP